MSSTGRIQAFGFFLWEKRQNKKSWPQSEHWDEILSALHADWDYFSPFSAVSEVSGCCTSWTRRRLLYCGGHRRTLSSFSWGKTSQKKQPMDCANGVFWFATSSQAGGTGRIGGVCLVGLGLLFKHRVHPWTRSWGSPVATGDFWISALWAAKALQLLCSRQGCGGQAEPLLGF